MKSHDVRFWETRPNKTAKGASFTVRWTVAGREKSHTLSGKARAERYKSRLLEAADQGEAFDVGSGLPESLHQRLARSPGLSMRRSSWMRVGRSMPLRAACLLVEGLIAVTPVLVKSQRGAPDPVVLRQALRRWASIRRAVIRTGHPRWRQALRWLARASLPISALEEPSTVSRRGCLRPQTRRVGGGRAVLPASSACLLCRAEVRGAGEASFGKSARRG